MESLNKHVNDTIDKLRDTLGLDKNDIDLTYNRKIENLVRNKIINLKKE